MFNKIKALFGGQEKVSLRASFWVFFSFAVIGLITSLVLSIDETELMRNPNAVLSCSINFVLNCSVVMKTWQAHVFFNIPNMYIGLMAFPVLVTVAVATLWGGATYKKSFLAAMNIGVFFGTIFAYWLFFNSLYVIQVLCPWCLVVTFSCTMLLSTSTNIALRSNSWNFNNETNAKIQKFLDKGYLKLVTASWIVLLIALVFIQFGSALFA